MSTFHIYKTKKSDDISILDKKETKIHHVNKVINNNHNNYLKIFIKTEIQQIQTKEELFP